MTELIRSGQADGLGHIDTTQGEFRSQVDVVADELRQLAGNADVPSDPLTAPYVLYVNSYTGSDNFVGGQYTSTGELDRRISMQRLECGYTQSRPFRTINRAAIEAAIITSRSYFTTDAERNRALVSIVVAPGEHVALNGDGLADNDTNFPSRAQAWDVDAEADSDAAVEAFNSSATGGIIMPRGCSLVSLDLRNTIVRPSAVPVAADESATNRRLIFKCTGNHYSYGFTFKDSPTVTTSHHLLSCFGFASEAELNDLYSKVLKSFAAGANIDATNCVTRDFEWQIVGQQPLNPTPAVDTVSGASPYIFNSSVRSILGLCGIYADGSVSGGFRSMVTANFTGVSLQTDVTCWQIYNRGTEAWEAAASQQAVINANPNDVRMNPVRRSFHVRASDNAVIQEVSVFAIGQGCHHLAESGGEISVTNSNSNWGGVGGLAIGFKDDATPADTPFTPVSIRRALDPFQATNNVAQITLGEVAAGVANDATTIDLTVALAESTDVADQPAVLADKKYSLKEDDYIWISNTRGDDYRAQLTAAPWDATNPDQINVQSAFETPAGADPGSGVRFNDLAGARVYVRRLVDSRNTEQRTYSVRFSGAEQRRVPVRDYVLRDAADTWNTARLSAVAESKQDRAQAGTVCDLVLRNANTVAGDEEHSATDYYHAGDTIQREGLHLVALRDNYGAFDAANWDENYVHMASDYSQEGYIPNIAPKIIFDGDTQDVVNATNCGFTLASAIVVAQYQSAVDYKGLDYYLETTGVALGLVPVAAVDRDAAIPAGTANVEFRRPSQIRMYSHSWEWSGFLNYSKALPQYQGDLSFPNRFTYYFTNEDGGKVYASGFNEEGFQVSNRGLTNLDTGREINPFNPDTDVDFFVPSATTEEQGVVELATPAEVQEAVNGNPPLFGGSGPLALQPNAIPAIISALGLMQDQDTDFYVAANAADVPDAHVEADGAATGDFRTLAERRAALVCSDLEECFDRINSRTPVSGRDITIHLYTATTTAADVEYNGNGSLNFENQNGVNALSAQHQLGQFRFDGKRVRFRNVNLRHNDVETGIRSSTVSQFIYYGGRYELNVNSEASHYYFIGENSEISLYTNQSGSTTPAVDLEFVLDDGGGNASRNSGQFVCAKGRYDSRHSTGTPELTWTCSHTGGDNLTAFIRFSQNMTWYARGGADDADTDYNLVLNFTGSDAEEVEMLRLLSLADGAACGVWDDDGDEVTCTATIPNSVNKFVFVSAAGRIIFADIDNMDQATRICQAVADAGANVGNGDSYQYEVGSGSVVNNDFKETGEDRNLS